MDKTRKTCVAFLFFIGIPLLIVGIPLLIVCFGHREVCNKPVPYQTKMLTIEKAIEIVSHKGGTINLRKDRTYIKGDTIPSGWITGVVISPSDLTEDIK